MLLTSPQVSLKVFSSFMLFFYVLSMSTFPNPPFKIIIICIVVSQIIAKLLNKSPMERYQSSYPLCEYYGYHIHANKMFSPVDMV